MPQVLVLRPEPGNTRTCDAARARGLSPHAAPLFAYVSLDWHLPDGITWNGLLIGSAAAITQGSTTLEALRPIPVHAVGAATARAAQAAGFTVSTTGGGGLQPLVDTLPPGRYLRLTGEAHVPLAPPSGVQIDNVIAYGAQPQPLDPLTIAQIRAGPVLALLHSAEAARHFAQQCAAHGLPRGTIALACLAPRIAQAAGDGWRTIGIAQTPDDDAVLSLAGQMWQRL